MAVVRSTHGDDIVSNKVVTQIALSAPPILTISEGLMANVRNSVGIGLQIDSVSASLLATGTANDAYAELR